MNPVREGKEKPKEECSLEEESEDRSEDEEGREDGGGSRGGCRSRRRRGVRSVEGRERDGGGQASYGTKVGWVRARANLTLRFRAVEALASVAGVVASDVGVFPKTLDSCVEIIADAVAGAVVTDVVRGRGDGGRAFEVVFVGNEGGFSSVWASAVGGGRALFLNFTFRVLGVV